MGSCTQREINDIIELRNHEKRVKRKEGTPCSFHIQLDHLKAKI
uniref:Uncharacterized protein n=1 Tax=Rhizophora mucronata TaxID=61149 RepID=A0A2P2R0X3_RHIMU